MLKKYMLVYLLALVLLVAVFVKAFGADTVKKAQSASATAKNEGAAGVQETQPTETANYFEAFRGERESIRQQEIRYLDEVIATGNIDAQTLDQALEQKMALVDAMEKEFTVESMITAKGFKDAAVTFHNDSINVVVDAPTLSSAEVAQILDIVKRETGATAEKVKITAEGISGVS